ncbi:hypothetical protein [Rhizobium leguminosarum]|uniref:hypothetical protein n=1 Tax=Rhizobium leguminosarum TaxID=384 RepID=UPI0004BC3F4E|nr:hypothetical protein [Rhizobium leguminosarum]
MSHDLSLAQSHVFQLSRNLMVPVSLCSVDGEYGVLPSDEIDADDDLEIVHGSSHGRLIEPALCLRVPLASGRPQGRLRRGRVIA